LRSRLDCRKVIEVELELKDKTAIIVGGAQGIGRAIADSFIDEGARAAIVDCASEVDGFAGEVRQADVADFEAVKAVAKDLADQLGQIDHVVFSVGIGSGKFGFPFWNVEPADWMRVLEVNLLGAVHTAQAFAPFMREGDASGRSLLFLTSVAGQVGSQTDPPYSASKAGLINFMQCVAKDLAADGIRANALSPGMVKTSLNQSVWAASGVEESYEEWADNKIKGIAPLGQWQSPEEYGAMAVYLASPQAKNITGQTINIDGGQVMHS
jgi:2-hydroxycyclohexanecarboxyl-CoA dehydrogenase